MDYRLLVGITLISLALAAPSVDAQPVPSASATPPTPTVTPPSPQARSDVRIVIDTSGSMKQTDPKNLRVPALKLLVNLLPEGSRAGIWLFDTTARELVPVAPVNKEWKARAEAAATKIDSRGAFTNIEAALAAATAGWAGDAGGKGQHRHLILLTDGMVDVAKNQSINDVSREAILNQKIPAFQQAEVTIHTIALSDQSDQELLRQLALATGGWNAVAENAEQLQRTFLEIFNQAAPHDSIPIRDNRFTVDSSVQEFTLLVLLKPGANPTSLTAPDGSPLTQGRVPENARWLHEAGYDLITVTNPLAGDWKLNAAVDPGNQVFVVANLKMEPADIPSYLQAEDKPDIAATFTESGHPITREDFLSLLTLRAELREAAEKRDLVLSRDSDRPGTFKADVSDPLTPGEYTLLITADGRTFQRETRQAFRVMSDMLQVTTKTDASSDPPSLIILLTPNPETLAPDNVTVQATLTDQSNQSRELAPERTESAWQIKLPAPVADDRWVVNFVARSKGLDGEAVPIPLKPLILTADSTAAKPPVEERIAPTQPKAPDWRMTTAIALGLNAILLLAIWLTYRVMKKRSETAIAELLSKLEP